jgi:hypothetical protein
MGEPIPLAVDLLGGSAYSRALYSAAALLWDPERTSSPRGKPEDDAEKHPPMPQPFSSIVGPATVAAASYITSGYEISDMGEDEKRSVPNHPSQGKVVQHFQSQVAAATA